MMNHAQQVLPIMLASLESSLRLRSAIPKGAANLVSSLEAWACWIAKYPSLQSLLGLAHAASTLGESLAAMQIHEQKAELPEDALLHFEASLASIHTKKAELPEACKMKDIPPEWTAKLREAACNILAQSEEKKAANAEILIASKAAALKEAVASLEGICGGAPGGKIWSSKLAKNADLKVVFRTAEKELVADGIDEWPSKCEAIATCKAEYSNCCGRFAFVVDKELVAPADRVKHRALQTYVERALINLYKEDNEPADGKAQVTKLIKQLRSAGLREKEVLPIAVFKRTFQTLSK